MTSIYGQFTMSDTSDSLRELLLGRQPIIDLKQELIGYELFFRTHGPAPRTGRINATAAVVCSAFGELGIASALGPNRAFINADAEFLQDDALELLPAHAVVFELDIHEVPDEALLARCRTLRERGYTLALCNYRGLDAISTPLLPLVNIVKIDLRQTPIDDLEHLAGSLARLPLKLLAEKVETREEMERCREAGFHMFQGFYFAQPTIVSGRQLSSSQLGLIRLINLVARDADTVELEENFKREPGLTVNLLRLVNSVGTGLGRRVDSLRQAVTILGRRQLTRWLQLLLMASPADGSAPERNPLLQLAALRGRLMELMVGRTGAAKLGDAAFLTGIMSLMPAALGLPMNEILAQIAVGDDVSGALLEHEGQLGKLLRLVECFDADDAADCDTQLAQIDGLDREALTEILTEALAWIHADGE